MVLLKSGEIFASGLSGNRHLAAFGNQTHNLLNNKSLPAFTVDLQWMSASTVGIYSIYTINVPIRLIVIEELLLA